MFTGIIEEVGRVRDVRSLGGGIALRIGARFAPELRVDQSVAVNGACQTVVAVDGDAFEVVAIEETLRKTNLGSLRPGAAVNLERAMRPGDRLDGHFVQGHVDATGTIVSIEPEATSRLYTIRIPESFAANVIPVGSIALDGVSLTIARLQDAEVTVAIIPYTLEHTTIRDAWKPGTAVNLEFDLIGKYVARWLETRENGRETAAEPTIDEAWLKKQGF
ncbi:MAG TPA: riboflavin synthase [Rhodothermales bacterium]